MTSLILYQSGRSCYDPYNNCEYDPWSNHIWDVLSQVREWSETIDIHFIVDVPIKEITDNKKFEELRVTPVSVDTIPTNRDLSFLASYANQTNLTKTSLIRFFYIESLMRNLGIERAFTFDNDIMVYEDLSSLARKMSMLFDHIAITPHSPDEMVCGMMWIPSLEKISSMNDFLIEEITTDSARTEMRLLKIISKRLPMSELPIWIDGNFSLMATELGGIFDPSSIGQFLGGTHNGHPPMTVHPPQFLAYPLASKNYSFWVMVDEHGRKYYHVVNNLSGNGMKINSLHMHCKRMKEFMSRA
jgi:hypothetical protein